jgi:hypothetical protein
MSAKTENYTEAQTVELVGAYRAASTPEDRLIVVAEFAERFGKTVNSIRAKLVREKVYVAKVYTNKNGEKPVKKDNMVSDIAKKIGMSVEACDSLEKVNKAVLIRLLHALG